MIITNKVFEITDIDIIIIDNTAKIEENSIIAGEFKCSIAQEIR